jgi:hypothetical protein
MKKVYSPVLPIHRLQALPAILTRVGVTWECHVTLGSTIAQRTGAREQAGSYGNARAPVLALTRVDFTQHTGKADRACALEISGGRLLAAAIDAGVGSTVV